MKPHSKINNDSSRPRHSCWLFVAVVLFGLIGLSIMAYHGASHFIHNRALAGMSAAERQDFFEWAYTPIDVPPEFKTPLAPLPNNIITERKAFLKAASEASVRLNPYHNAGSDGLFQRALKDAPITPEEWDQVTSDTAPFSVIVERGRRLVSRPEYVLNDRRIPGPYIRYAGLTITANSFCLYAITKAHNGDWTSAVEALDVIQLLLRRDPHAHLVISAMAMTSGQKIQKTALTLSRSTSDTVVLKSLLEFMSQGREHVIVKYPELFCFTDRMAIMVHMIDDGFRDDTSYTQADLHPDVMNYYGYMRWLLSELPSCHPRLPYVRDELRTSVNPDRSMFRRILDQINFGLMKPLVRPVYKLLLVEDYVAEYKADKSLRTRARARAASYNLTQLKLAQRIAAIEHPASSKPVAELLLEYLDAIPPDPFSTGTLLFSDERNQFYSVGKDGIDGTGDEVFGDK